MKPITRTSCEMRLVTAVLHREAPPGLDAEVTGHRRAAKPLLHAEDTYTKIPVWLDHHPSLVGSLLGKSLTMQQAMYKTALLLEKDALECTDREERARST